MNKFKTSISFIFLIVFFLFTDCIAYELTPEDKERMGPVGIQLYKEWTETIGFSAIDLVKEMDPAPEIKPGMEITPENAKNYPGLKKILPETMYKRLDPNHFLPYERMIIVRTRPRYRREEYQRGTKENMGKCTINPATLMLENYVYGIPFPRHPSPLEMCWNHNVTSSGMEENLYFDPISAITYNKSRKADTSWKGSLGWYTCRGRALSDFDPVTHESLYFKGKGILYIGTFLLTYPQDLVGTAFLRYRYWDSYKPDLFLSYLPALKRIRVLSGSDSQDPMVGSEVTWDMWGGDWQKQPTRTIFPNEYKILGKKVLLMPVFLDSPGVKIKKENFITKWEKRPVRVLEIKSLDPSYIFSKRIMYVDMELFQMIYEEYFDRRGNLWRTWEDFRFMNKEGANMWEATSTLNWISQRHTLSRINTQAISELDPGDFDMRWLTRMAR